MKRPLRLGLWACPGIAASTTGKTGSGAEMVQRARILKRPLRPGPRSCSGIAASDTSMKRPLRLGLWACPGIAASTTGRTGSGAEMVQ